MAEQSMLWTTNGTGDGTGGGYSQQRMYDFFRKVFARGNDARGVLYGVGNNLATHSNEFDPLAPVTVDTGAAIVYGFFYENTSVLSFSLGTKPANTAVNIVLEANWAAQTVRAKAVWAANGVTTYPTLVDTPGTAVQLILGQYIVGPSGINTASASMAQYAYFATRMDSSSLDDASIGHSATMGKVPMMRKRRGGDPYDWSIPGTNDYKIDQYQQHAHIWAGSFSLTGTIGTTDVVYNVLYPLAPDGVNCIAESSPGTGNPLIFLNVQNTNLQAWAVAHDRCSFDIHVKALTGSVTGPVTVHWMCLGLYASFIVTNGE